MRTMKSKLIEGDPTERSMILQTSILADFFLLEMQPFLPCRNFYVSQSWLLLFSACTAAVSPMQDFSTPQHCTQPTQRNIIYSSFVPSTFARVSPAWFAAAAAARWRRAAVRAFKRLPATRSRGNSKRQHNEREPTYQKFSN